MAATQHTKVTPDEFNSARTQVVSVLGTSTTGTPGAIQGYGQVVASSAVAQHQKVTEADLDNLRLDIVKSRTHQSGSAPTITNVSKDNKLEASLFNSYSTLASSVVTDKDVIAANQIETVTRIINTESYAAYEGVQGTGGGWKNYAEHTITVNFDNANDARYFFNSGSSFIFSASRTGGTVAPTIGLNQNQSWTNLLSTVTTEAPTFDKTDFYTLTNTFQTWYNKNATGTYSANYYRISIKSNVANNQYGGATQIQFKVEFVDAFNDGNTTNYDGVDGILTSTMVEKSPKGVSNGGAISVPKPFSYASSPATGFTESGTPIYITAAYTVTPSPTSVTENSATINFTFNATNYNTGNTVTFKIIASTTVSLNDFVQTGWTQGPDTVEGYKTLTRTATNTGSYATSSCSVSIVTNPDATTEGTETFTIEATGTADGSGGGFPVTATFTVTDSSKTPTPGISLSEVDATLLNCIVGEGYTNVLSKALRITSSPLTGSASLTVYGFYLDLIDASSITGYRAVLPDGTTVNPGGNYYTFPTPVVLSPSSTYDITFSVFSNSGPSGNYPVYFRVRSNGGAADGSGPNTNAPSYNTQSLTTTAVVSAATIDFDIIASNYNAAISYPPGGTASGTVTLTLRNRGNASGTISNYSVTSSSGNLSVSYNTGLIGAVVGQGATRIDFVGLGSNTAGEYFLTASITGTNPFTPPSSFSRSDITVSVLQLFPEISVSVTNVSAPVWTQTSDITVTYTNIGQATLTISNVSVTLGTFQQNLVQTAGRSTNTLAPGQSTTNKFTVRRIRIGSSNLSVVVTSDANTNPTFTATGSVTGTATTPTVSIFSLNGSVQNSSSFTTRGIIRKDSDIYVYFDNTERAACHPICAVWEDGTLHQVFINAGLTKPIDAMTDPDAQYCNDRPELFGTGLGAWKGLGGSEETRYWKTGVGIIWIALKNGTFDNGVQSYFQVPGRMGDGVNQSTNQIRVEVEIVPKPRLIVSPTDFVQIDNWSFSVTGLVENAQFFVLGTFQDRPNQITTFTEATGVYQTPAEGDGRFSVGPVSSALVPVGSYNRFVRTKYKGTNYDSPSVAFEVQSPSYALITDVDPENRPNLNGQWVALPGDAAFPTGERYYFRRTGATNGTYTVAIFGFADDLCEIFIQGISRGTATMTTYAITNSTNVSVSDGFVHWIFRYNNFGGPGYFAAAIWLGSPLTLYAGSGNNLGPSRW